MPQPDNFLDSESTKQGTRDLFIAILSLLSMAYVGCNRFSVIPLIVALSNGLADLCGWWTWTDGLRSSTASVFFNYVGFYVGELVLPMYGYFIVEKILPPGRGTGSLYGGIIGRKPFMMIFWPMQIASLGLRLGALIYATVSYAETGSVDAPKPLYGITQAMFLLLTVMETFTAYILIVIFHRSRKVSLRFLGGKRLSLLKHMILSTEIRVASLAALYITRACCEWPKRYNETANRVDQLTLAFIFYFPVLLVWDCILRKSINIEVDLQARIERCSCLERGSSGGAASHSSDTEKQNSNIHESKEKLPSKIEVAGAFAVE